MVQRHLKIYGLDYFSQTRSDVLLKAMCIPVSPSQLISKGHFIELRKENWSSGVMMILFNQ